jgi:hypothetical protein
VAVVDVDQQRTGIFESEIDNTYASIQEDSTSKPRQTVFETFDEVTERKLKKKQLCANKEGFSLHADTSVHPKGTLSRRCSSAAPGGARA